MPTRPSPAASPAAALFAALGLALLTASVPAAGAAAAPGAAAVTAPAAAAGPRVPAARDLPAEPGRHGERAQPRGEPRPRPGAPAPGLPVAAMELRGASARGRAAGHVLVRFADGLPAWQQDAVAAGLGAPRLRRARFGRFSRVEVPPGETPESMVRRFRAHPSVAWAETDPLLRAAGHGRVTAAQHVNDPFFPRQWHMHRIGAEEALERNPGDGAGVIVAVIDTGVAAGNGSRFPLRRAPDMETTQFLPGFDFVDNDAQPFDLGSAADPDRPFSTPRFGHGTFAASVIAATVGNGLAGIGVAPRVTILPVRVLDVDGFGTSSDVAEGIRFAVDAGARVLNLSLGGTGIAQVTREALQHAADRGVVVVAAAGNDAEEPDVFEGELGNDVAWPARFPTVIAVGATNFDDQRAGYSNFGPSLDLVAPGGGDSGRELPANVRDAVLATSFVYDPVADEAFYGGFWATGTSFACPHAAGAAALLVALGVDDPEAVRAMLELTVRELGGEGFDTQTGFGLLDAAAAHRGLGFTD
jgi:serine protease